MRQSCARRRHHHVRHGRRLRHRCRRVGAGPDPPARPARIDRDLHQGLLADGPQPQRTRAVAQAHRGGVARVARALADGSRRPPAGPPLRLRGPARGDDARLRRPGAPGQGALRGRLGVDGRADRGRAAPGRRNGLRPHRLEPTPILPDLARDRSGGRPAVPEGGGGPDRVVAARSGRPDRKVPAGCVRPAGRVRGPPVPRAGR